MNLWLNRLKLFLLLGVGLACVVCFFIVSLSLLLFGFILGCVLFCIHAIRLFFRRYQKHPPLHIDKNGNLVIEHDPTS